MTGPLKQLTVREAAARPAASADAARRPGEGPGGVWSTPTAAPSVQPIVRRAFPPLDAAQQRLNLCRYFDPVAVFVAAVVAYLAVYAGTAARGLGAIPAADAIALGTLPWVAVVALRLSGLYNAALYLRGRRRFERLLGRLTIASVVATGVALAVDFALRRPAALAPLAVAGAAWATVFGATLVVRGLVFALTSPWSQPGGHHVLLVGTGARALRLYRDRYADVSDRVQMLGLVTPSASTAPEPSSPHALGTIEQLEEILVHRAVDEVLVALPLRFCYADIQQTFDTCARIGVPATYIDDAFTAPADPAGGEFVPGLPMLRLRVAPEDRRLLVKRAIDLTGAVLGVLALSPLLLLTALAIKLTSHGPVIFRQQRYGLNRRLFTIYKFRTMGRDAEERQHALEAHNEADGPVFKIRDDPRMTPLGRLLRRTSVDELPQLFNVILGNMSLVGPRPLPMRDVERFSGSWLMRRFSVLPGITGPWQVSGRSALGFDDWVRLDLDYIDGWSLRRDWMLLAATIPAVLRGHGAA